MFVFVCECMYVCCTAWHRPVGVGYSNKIPNVCRKLGNKISTEADMCVSVCVRECVEWKFLAHCANTLQKCIDARARARAS